MPAEQTLPASGPPHRDRAVSGGLEIGDIFREASDRAKSHFRVAGTEGPQLEIVGWVLGTESAATEVEILSGGEVAGRAPVVLERPDIAELFPDLPEAATAGFRIELAAEGRGESELEVRVRLKDESYQRLGRVHVRADGSGLMETLRRG